MPRKRLQVAEEVNLEELITKYADDKEQLDSWKKVCDEENSKIKDVMVNDDSLCAERGKKWVKQSGSVIATVTMKKKETVNEDRLLDVIRLMGISGIIKTKEYVDMEALEAAMYRGELTKDQLLQLDTCREIKFSPELRISKAKEDK